MNLNIKRFVLAVLVAHAGISCSFASSSTPMNRKLTGSLAVTAAGITVWAAVCSHKNASFARTFFNSCGKVETSLAVTSVVLALVGTMNCYGAYYFGKKCLKPVRNKN